MLKKVLLILMILTTAVRFFGVVFLLALGNTSLPAVVLVTTSVTVLYGVFLLVWRFIFTLRLKHFIQFFVVQTIIFAFNLIFVSRNVLLQITLVEVSVVGTLLDILIGCVAIYYCIKEIRRIKFARSTKLLD